MRGDTLGIAYAPRGDRSGQAPARRNSRRSALTGEQGPVELGHHLPHAVVESEAQDLLTLAFLAEAIEEIENEAIADDILGRLEGWLVRRRKG